jgi:phage-related protein (TIGR01555 family)
MDAAALFRGDGWQNVIAGIGGRRDKRTHTRIGSAAILDDQELGLLYLGDGLGRRIVDVVADDMTREGVELDGDPEDIATLTAEMDRLHMWEALNQAVKWRRLYGGSLIVLGAMDGATLDKPLTDRVRAVEFLRVADRTQVDWGQVKFEPDSRKASFGQVVAWPIRFNPRRSALATMVHPSRVLEFRGVPIPQSLAVGVPEWTTYWGTSVLHAVWDRLADYGTTMSSVVNIIFEFIVWKYKLADLAAKLSEDNGAAVVARMEIMAMCKSVLNAQLLDATEGEDATRDTASVAGLSDVVDRVMMALSAVTGIPLTRLFGRSPAGLNATGESDERNYYDQVRSDQQTQLSRAIDRIIEVLCASRDVHIDYDTVDWRFRPLRSPTAKEEKEEAKLDADRKYAEMQTHVGYIDRGVYDADEARRMIAEEYGLEDGPAPEPPAEPAGQGESGDAE